MAEGGYIKLHRKIRDHWIWEKPLELKWWLDLLMLANHRPRKILINGKLVMIDTGQCHTSEKKLAVRWSASRTTVDKFLVMLEKDKMIVLEKSRQDGTTIKVLNYKAYQAFLDDDEDNEIDNCVGIESASKVHRPVHKQEPKELEEPKEPKKEKIKEENHKESMSAKPTSRYESDSVEYLATQYLIKQILENNPRAKVPTTPEQINKWCDTANKVLRLDNKPVNEFKKVLEFAATDDFWSANILSMNKFREKYDQLFAKMQPKSKPASRGEQPLTGIEKLRQSIENERKQKEGDVIDV